MHAEMALRNEGMKVLINNLGKVEAERMNEPRRKQRGIVRSPVELHSGFNTFKNAPRGWVLNPSARINQGRRRADVVLRKPEFIKHGFAEL